MERWRDRVALVTGASVGIGASICTELAKHGIKVIGCARNVKKIEELAKKLPPNSLHGIKCDLRKESDIMQMFEEIKRIYGKLDICINNAGFSTMSPLISGETEDFRAMLEVNVLALCICSREALKIMLENNIDDGQIIQISSIAAHKICTDVPGANFYTGTKTMVRILTEGLRLELRAKKSRIRVSSVSPGVVKTEFVYRMTKDEKAVEGMYDQFGYLTPEDIADRVISILKTPEHVDINEVIIRPVTQEL